MSNEVKVELENWRGYSAFEVAKNNGYNGTEKEWLESLGSDVSVTVNGRQVDDNGNIIVTAEHITLVEEGQRTVSQKLTELDEEKFDAEDLVQDAAEGGSEKPLSAEAGKKLLHDAETRTKSIAQTVTLPAANWEQDGDIYGQSVVVEGITEDTSKTSAIVTPTVDRAKEEEWNYCEVRASAQGNGVLVFTSTDLPEVDLEANVMVVIQGVSE